MKASIDSSGYSANRLSPAKFKEAIDTLADKLPLWLEATKCDGIVVCGTSGLSIGYGLLARSATPPPTIIVRKSESHDSRVTAIGGTQEVSRLLMVDDMVDTGATVQFVYERLMSYSVELVACGCYNPLFSGDPGRIRNLESLQHGRKVFVGRGDAAECIPVFSL